MTSFLNLGPEEQQRQVLGALAEDGRARREERDRKAAAQVARGEQATAAFLAQMRGEPLPSSFAGAVEQLAAVDADEEITARRCHALTDRFLANGGTVGRLRSLLEADLR